MELIISILLWILQAVVITIGSLLVAGVVYLHIFAFTKKCNEYEEDEDMNIFY